MSSIFVSIACLLDNDIVNTIRDCFQKSVYPEKITIGVCYQKDFDEPDVLEPLEKKYNIKVVRIPWKEAKGPMLARSKILSLVTNETFFFQIDCHTRFFQDWDKKIIKEYNLCLEQSDKPIISYYPININNMNNPEMLKKIYHIATFREISEDAVKTSGRIIDVPKTPLKGIGLTAAMLFGKTTSIIENPVDPNLPFALHSGEQVLYSMRFWTKGYDFFTPSQHIIATEYITNKERIEFKYRKYLNHESGKWKNIIWKKTQYLLGLTSINDVPKEVITSDIDKWREGYVRSLKEYWEMTGIYLKLKTIFPNMRV